MSLFSWLLLVVSIAQIHAYDPQEARTALYYAYGAYCNASQLIQWSCKWCDYVRNFTIANDGVITGQMQTFIGYDHDLERIVIAFRGIGQNAEDWIDNIDISQTYYPLPKPYHASESYIASGFLDAWKQMMTLGFPHILQSILTQYPTSDILLTGHSMGGAIAEIAALELNRTHSSGAHAINVITFGSPRWCTKSVADYFNAIINSSWRIVNKHDVVPNLPYMNMGDYGYYHTSTQIYYEENNTYVECDDNDENESCQYMGYSIADHKTYFGLYQDCVISEIKSTEDCSCDTPAITPTEMEANGNEIEIIYKFKQAASQGLSTISKIALAIALVIGYLLCMLLCCCLIKTSKDLQLARSGRGTYIELDGI